MGSRLNYWIYWTSLLQLHLIIRSHILNRCRIKNLSLYFFWFSEWSPVLLFSVWISDSQTENIDRI
jgi:hypothetical protein